MQKEGLISCPLEGSGYVSAEQGKGRAEARSFGCSGLSSRALAALRVRRGGQDQSTFRIIFAICSGKGSDVRY